MGQASRSLIIWKQDMDYNTLSQCIPDELFKDFLKRSSYDLGVGDKLLWLCGTEKDFGNTPKKLFDKQYKEIRSLIFKNHKIKITIEENEELMKHVLRHRFLKEPNFV